MTLCHFLMLKWRSARNEVRRFRRFDATLSSQGHDLTSVILWPVSLSVVKFAVKCVN